MRDAVINLRALPQQLDLIDRAAQLLGKSRSDFVLEAACEKARSVVLDQVFFNLDEDRLKQFTAMLDAPPAPNPGLERLMAVKAPLGGWNKPKLPISPSREGDLASTCPPAAFSGFFQPQQHAVRRQGQASEAHTCGVKHRIGQRSA